MLGEVRADSCARMLRDLCGMFNRNDNRQEYNLNLLAP